VFPRRDLKPLTEVIRRYEGPHFGFDALSAQYFCGIDSRDTQADVADMAVRGEILVSKDDVQGVLLGSEKVLVAISEFTSRMPLNRTEYGKPLITLRKEFIANL